MLSELHVVGIERSDSALFTCMAMNAYGDDETNIQVIVQGK